MANYRKIARQDARRYGLDPNIFERQINQESGFNPNSTSGAGAQGIAQFMPSTAKGLGINPNNPRQALQGAAKLMSGYVKKYGSYSKALEAYNGGPGVVGHSLPAETQNYVKIILNGHDPGGLQKPSAASPSPTRTPKVNISAPGRADALRTLLMQSVAAPSAATALTGTNIAAALISDSQQSSSTPTVPTAPRLKYSAGAATPTLGKDTTSLKKFDGKEVSGWIADQLTYARKHGWKGSVTSGYRSYADQARIYNSGVRPAAKPGQSNHERKGYLQGAVDVTDPQTLSKILTRAHSRLKYAGAKDPVHFSVPRNGSY